MNKEAVMGNQGNALFTLSDTIEFAMSDISQSPHVNFNY
jgi:hypothetical protein